MSVNDPEENNKKIAYILDIGEMLLSNGADVNRVEDTAERLSEAFGFTDCQVHAINSSIIITVTPEDGIPMTQARRIKKINTDLNKVSELNNLSRDICAGLTSMDIIPAELENIQNTTVYSPFMQYFAYAAGGAFFTLFFGGTWKDMLFSVPIALMIRFIKMQLNNFDNNKMVDNIILSAVCSFLAIAGERLFPFLHADMIIIGDIMLLIPGLAFCNSIHDMVMGDTISGVLSLFDTILRALSIAIGYVAAWGLVGRLL